MAYKDLQVLSSVGRGSFGEVYRARYNAAIVAVKQVAPDAMTGNERQALMQEAGLMFNLPPHPHVIQFMGICEDRPPSLFIVVEVRALAQARALLGGYAQFR